MTVIIIVGNPTIRQAHDGLHFSTRVDVLSAGFVRVSPIRTITSGKLVDHRRCEEEKVVDDGDDDGAAKPNIELLMMRMDENGLPFGEIEGKKIPHTFRCRLAFTAHMNSETRLFCARGNIPDDF